MKKTFIRIAFCLCCLTAMQMYSLTAQAQNVLFDAQIHYPTQIKKGETAFIEVTITAVLPDNAEPSVKISNSTNDPKDFTLIPGYPTSAIRFNKAGNYAFSVNSGFLLKDV